LVAVVSGYVALLGLLGLGLGAGLVVLTAGLRGTDDPGGTGFGGPWRRSSPREHLGRWLAASGTAGLLVGIFTGWVIGGLLAAMAAWGLPDLLGPGAEQSRMARLEGIAGWTEMLRDTLAAAAGLEQTIMATAPTAPVAIRPQVRELAARLEGGERLPGALRRLAGDLADPVADLVIAALVLAAGHEARQVTSLLGELAGTARGQVEMLQRVDASRARTRTTLRVVVGTTLTFAGGLIVLNPGFLTPYDTVAGQFVLLVIGALFTAAFGWLRRMARSEQPQRFFTGTDSPHPAGTVQQEAI
jgi:hypothetical protein